MKLNTLYDELKDIIVNKNNDYIKMMNFESSTPRSLLAAFNGIYDTLSIINCNSCSSVAALSPLRPPWLILLISKRAVRPLFKPDLSELSKAIVNFLY